MKNFIGLILILILFSTSCKEEVKPSLPDEKLVAILSDLHIAEAAFMTLNQNVKDSIHKVYYQQIFEIHDVQDSIFYKDFEILRRDPKKLEEIYNKVIEEIEQLDMANEDEDAAKKKK